MPNQMSTANYMDLLFNIVVPREQFVRIECMDDLVRVVEQHFKPILDIEQTG